MAGVQDLDLHVFTDYGGISGVLCIPVLKVLKITSRVESANTKKHELL